MRYMNFITVTAVYVLLMLLQVVPGTETLAKMGKAHGLQSGMPLKAVR